MGGAYYGDPELRTLAATHDAGLLLPRLTSISQDVEFSPVMDFLRNASLGGADGLVMLLSRLAQESGHPEISAAPLLLWGHSRSGHFAATFAALYPQRTVAVVGYHTGAAGMAGHQLDVLSTVPALILMARADVEASANRAGWPAAEMLWRSGRSRGAPWTFGIEPDAVHQNPNDLKNANGLVIPWMTAVLRQRLSTNDGKLRVVPDASAYLGDLQTGDVAPEAAFSGAKRDAVWLPDERSAQGWRAVVGAAK